MNSKLTSWGQSCVAEQEGYQIRDRFQLLPELTGNHSYLAYGNGRSYGDSCLNAGGLALYSKHLDRYLEFNPLTGVLRCESGILLSEILDFVVPQGWFLPVTPGTRFVTLGGAIANDVHGKNHHVAGTFGHFVLQFSLLRSDQQHYTCSLSENPHLFFATIGGLGLTGFITTVDIQLKKIGSPWINAESIKYESLSEFFSLCKESDQEYEYTVSWVDCLGRGKNLGRGVFIRGNHAAPSNIDTGYRSRQYIFPVKPPVSLVNNLSLRAFNTLYYHKQLQKRRAIRQHYQSFFYPLDGILHWNRLYGSKGFYQYQCVVPFRDSEEVIRDLLNVIAESGMGSFLAVLKLCGDKSSPGMLSFPMQGISLALDFPNQGKRTFDLFKRLDEIVDVGDGRLYPAKDANMSGSLFRKGYPNWEEFTQYVDPKFSSSFWRRVME